MNRFERNKNNLEHDPFPDRKPVKLAKNWLHVKMAVNSGHKPCCSILNTLQLVQLTGWQTKKQGITIIKPRRDKSMHQLFR